MQMTTTHPAVAKSGIVETRYMCDQISVRKMETAELRRMFLLENLFEPGSLRLVYTDVDRAVVGGAVPLGKPLALVGGKELAAETFCMNREVGILNIGGSGFIEVDGQVYKMDKLDCLYVGRGTEAITLNSSTPDDPAAYYILSYPAHKALATAHIQNSSVEPINLGSPQTANERLLYKYIYPDGVQSCQLTMGLTQIVSGSVWNTMPPHTHGRRTEVYCYFDLPQDHVVMHFMGEPQETRHIVTGNRQAVLSPAWSIHGGAGTSNYSFIWGMGGENQEFDDMDLIEISELR